MSRKLRRKKQKTLKNRHERKQDIEAMAERAKRNAEIAAEEQDKVEVDKAV